jgi:hypothetical protein
LPPALDFPVLLGISGLYVHMLDPALHHDGKPHNLIRPVNYCMSYRIRRWAQAMGVDPMVLQVLLDDALGGAEDLTARIADLSDDLVSAESAFLVELNQEDHMVVLEMLNLPPERPHGLH